MSVAQPGDEGVFAAPSVPSHRADSILLWLALGSAVATVIIGVLMLVWPKATLAIAAFLFGLWLLFSGLQRVVRAIMASGADGTERALTAIVGIIFILGGILALKNLFVSLAVIVALVGVMWTISGIVEIASAFRGSPGARPWLVIAGVVSILGGIVVLLWPGPSLMTLVYLIGIWLILIGIVQAFLAIRARQELTAGV